MVVWDIDQGGRGLGDWARDVIREQATPTERHQLGEWTRDALADRTPTEEEQKIRSLGTSGTSSDSRDWDQRALGRLLLDFQAHTLDD